MQTTHKAAILRLFNYAKGYRADIYLASLYSILNKFFDILPEVLIGFAVDTVVNRNTSFLSKLGMPNASTQIIFLGGLTFAIWCLESLFEYLYSVKWRNLAQAIQHKLRLDAYQHIQNADMSYFENVSSGNMVSILNDDINQLERFLDNGVNTIIQVLGSTILIGIIFFVIAPKIALLAFLPVPLILFGAYYFQNLIGPRYAKVRAKAGELTARFTNNITGIATIKSYTAEEYEVKSLEKQSDDYQQANFAAIKISSAMTPIIRIAVLLGFLSALVYGGLETIHGSLAVGAYSVLVFLTQRLLWPFTRLAEMTDQYYRAMASADRVLNLLAVPIHITSGERKHTMPSLKGEIKFEQVNFSYGKGLTVLQNLNIVIPAGDTVAFVGSTGSGKSTLVKLLMRFYDPTWGTIKIDDHEIKDFDLNNLRQHIGYVGQDVFLFEGTIAENISYGSFEATAEEIERAAKLAEADEFITRLPGGYQAQIGERGLRLSGGQRQRLSIARALLKNPPILILDEATSAVDNETEAAIQRSLDKIVIGRTTIIIAHRLSTVRHAQTIYVLEHGKIIESGSHGQLIAKQGQYADLWALQTGVGSQYHPA
ncbi:MAG: ABC transporter ATP-binding protein [Gammaproteobacteria bacterium]